MLLYLQVVSFPRRARFFIILHCDLLCKDTVAYCQRKLFDRTDTVKVRNFPNYDKLRAPRSAACVAAKHVSSEIQSVPVRKQIYERSIYFTSCYEGLLGSSSKYKEMTKCVTRTGEPSESESVAVRIRKEQLGFPRKIERRRRWHRLKRMQTASCPLRAR